MKKIILIILSFFILVSNSFSAQLPSNFDTSVQKDEENKSDSNVILFDFGGSLTTSNIFSVYGTDEKTFDNNERLEAWLKVPFGKDKTSFFALEGYYDFSLRTSNTNQSIISNVLDIPLFKFAFKLSSDRSNTTINLGRFFLADTTGYIFYQNIDGIFADVNFDKSAISFFAGYTGFINGNSVSLFNNPYEYKTGIYTLSPGYVVASSRLAFNIFNTQFFNAEFLAAFDTGKLDYNKMYATLTFNGAITQKMFYVLQSTLGMSIKSDGTEDLQLSNLSKADLSYYFNELESSFTLTGVFASANGTNIKEFKPVSSLHSSIIGTNYSSFTKFGLLYTFKPIDSLFVSLSSDGVGIFENQSTFTFSGIQWNCESKWQIVSDVYLALQVQQFIPFIEEEENYLLAGLKLEFTF